MRGKTLRGTLARNPVSVRPEIKGLYWKSEPQAGKFF
jgi:hypothetical protein